MKGKHIVVVTWLLMLVIAFSAFAQRTLGPGEYVEAEASWLTAVGGDTNTLPGELAFWGSGHLEVPIAIEQAGWYRLFVGARGTPAVDPSGKAWPLMKISLGKKDLGVWEVSTKGLYVGPAMKLEEGIVILTITYTNDYNDSAGDRNLLLDGIALAEAMDEDEIPIVMFKGKPAANYGELLACIPDTLEVGGYVEAEEVGFDGGDPTNLPGYMAFWGTAGMKFKVRIREEGLYKFLVGASGTNALDPITGKKWPIMKLSLDGDDICIWDVPEKAIYESTPLELKAGNYEFRLSFINDGNSPTGEDRNLFIDGISLGAIDEESETPAVKFKDEDLARYGKLYSGVLIAGSPKLKKVEPNYPEKRDVNYQAPTLALADLKLKLADGKEVQPSKFVNEVSLNGDWKILPPEGSKTPYSEDVDLAKGYWKADFDDSKWETIKVPLNWFVQYPEAQNGDKPFVKGWYRKDLTIGSNQKDKRVILHFDVVGYEALLYINGNLAGSHHGDFTAWEVDITRWVKFGSNNNIALRVLTDFGSDFTKLPEKRALGSHWGIGDIKGGIWQNVSLRYETPIYVEKTLITSNLADSSLEVQYFLQNNSGERQEFEFFGVVSSAMKKDPNAELANLRLGKINLEPGFNQGTVSFKLNAPQLWDLENPYLYYLTLALTDGKQVVATKTDRFGFRDFKVKGPHFYLNGERLFLFGENIPSNWFGGNRATQEEEKQRLINVIGGFKSQGYNMLRTAHMPILPVALDLADELGMLIYNEWGWSFSTNLDPVEFEKRNLKEVTEWVKATYNHPSVVMWSCGNEVNFSGNKLVFDQLNKQVALVRQLDRQGRPIVSFSGCSYGFGMEKLDTDVLDLHTYVGTGGKPWPYAEDTIRSILEVNTKIYGENGKLNKPFIIWECVGFSWGEVTDSSYVENNVDLYAEYVNKQSSIGEPNGIGFAGTLSLAAALDAERATAYGRALYGKRLLEAFRQFPQVQGFAPWYQDSAINAATLWNQPFLPTLKGKNKIPLHNVFTEKPFTQTLSLLNSQSESFQKLQVKFSLVSPKGDEQDLTELIIDSLEAWEYLTQEITLKIPASVKSGLYQLRIKLVAEGKAVGRNFYELFVQSQEILTQPIVTRRKIAVLAPNSELGQKALQLFKDLGISYTVVDDFETIEEYGVLIIPPTDKAYTTSSRLAIMPWIKNGGLLLQLAQNYAGDTFAGQTLHGALPLADLVIPGHPVFQGLDQMTFDGWDNEANGNVVDFGFSPFTVNALATRAPLVGESFVYNVVAEGTYGNGRIFTSQLNATPLWGKDSAASTYLRNVLHYLLENDLVYQNVRPWVVTLAKELKVDSERVIPIDLRPYATRSFTDEVEGDQLGGWTDQGNNDFRMMPLGEQTFAGVPFEIIDPAQNNDKSCIVLKGSNKAFFPEKVEGIKVNTHLSRLFFLHTAAWCYGGNIGEYRINYADGTVEVAPLISGVNINDWWTPGEQPDSYVALVKENPAKGTVALWTYAWENPYPNKEIGSIDFISYGQAVPVLVAISGEKLRAAAADSDYFEAEEDWVENHGGDKTNLPGEVAFWSNSHISFYLSVPKTGKYKIMIGARGTPATNEETKEKWPLMELSVDDQLIKTWDVFEKKAIYASPSLNLKPGLYKVKIAFTNDYNTAVEDRNLLIDGIATGEVENDEDLPDVLFKGEPLREYGRWF